MFLLLPGAICLVGDRRFYRARNAASRRPLLVGAGSIVLYLLACLSVVEGGFNPFICFQFDGARCTVHSWMNERFLPTQASNGAQLPGSSRMR